MSLWPFGWAALPRELTRSMGSRMHTPHGPAHSWQRQEYLQSIWKAGDGEVRWEPGLSEELWRAGEGTKITSKSLLCGEPPVMRLDRQVTGVNRTWIWARKLDRLWLQMAKREEKEPRTTTTVLDSLNIYKVFFNYCSLLGLQLNKELRADSPGRPAMPRAGGRPCAQPGQLWMLAGRKLCLRDPGDRLSEHVAGLFSRKVQMLTAMGSGQLGWERRVSLHGQSPLFGDPAWRAAWQDSPDRWQGARMCTAQRRPGALAGSVGKPEWMFQSALQDRNSQEMSAAQPSLCVRLRNGGTCLPERSEVIGASQSLVKGGWEPRTVTGALTAWVSQISANSPPLGREV